MQAGTQPRSPLPSDAELDVVGDGDASVDEDAIGMEDRPELHPARRMTAASAAIAAILVEEARCSRI
jgi:hypothetical protein